MPLRTVFFGSPDFAVPTLQALNADPAFHVTLVTTQGSREPSAVELTSQDLGIPVFRPESLHGAEPRERLQAEEADIFVVAAFGLIFRQPVLDLPRLGSLNLHPSILPRYRGAVPIPAAILQGDRETGVSLMVMNAGIDTGDVVSQERELVDSEDTSESLGLRLSGIAAHLAQRDIPRWARGDLPPQPQTADGTSLTRLLTKADGWIDWKQTAESIDRHVRAMWPWPRAWTTFDGTALQVHRISIVDLDVERAEPGAVVTQRKRLVVACADAGIKLDVVEPAGRRAMTGSAFLNGLRKPLTRLGASGSPGLQQPIVVPIATAPEN